MQENVFQLVLHAGLFVKLILLLLLSFSCFSWAVIGYKYWYLNRASDESLAFTTAFESTRDGNDLLTTAKSLPISPLARLYAAVSSAGTPVRQGEVSSSLRRHETLEAERLQTDLTFLATTGATAPFIGLLGTVWGIMNAFRGIGASGSASLAVVAPGIAEALITTAAGLAAAIPAVMAYNYFVSWAGRLTIQLEDFGEQLRDRLSKRAG